MNVSTTACFRFYGVLKDFLPFQRRGCCFSYTVKGRPAVKDTIEALGVPHTEIECILVNKKSVDFFYQLNPLDRVSVYPPGKYQIRSANNIPLRPHVPNKPSFVIDSHLGKLARQLRLLGFDSIYKRIFPDREIVKYHILENRIVMTRDIGLLKNKSIRWGYWVRAIHPKKQVKEIMSRYDLTKKVHPFSLCMECNGRIVAISKKIVFDRLPPKTRLSYKRFYLCTFCQKIYWKGAHYDKLLKWIKQAKRKIG